MKQGQKSIQKTDRKRVLREGSKNVKNYHSKKNEKTEAVEDDESPHDRTGIIDQQSRQGSTSVILESREEALLAAERQFQHKTFAEMVSNKASEEKILSGETKAADEDDGIGMTNSSELTSTYSQLAQISTGQLISVESIDTKISSNKEKKKFEG